MGDDPTWVSHDCIENDQRGGQAPEGIARQGNQIIFNLAMGSSGILRFLFVMAQGSTTHVMEKKYVQALNFLRVATSWSYHHRIIDE